MDSFQASREKNVVSSTRRLKEKKKERGGFLARKNAVGLEHFWDIHWFCRISRLNRFFLTS